MPSFAPGGERLSSAILYAAIVAIWAGVLIPRWLRRDSSSSSSDVSGASGASGEQVADEVPADGAREERRPGDSGERRKTPARDPGRRRVLAARRRLLGLLLLLAAGSGALAATKMAAWWVVVPPAVMLLGYLPLLRAASKADAERRELAARYRTAGGRRADYYGDAADAVTPVAHVTPVRGSAPAPASPAEVGDDWDEDYEIYDQYTDAKLRAVGD
jgi:hypothetical protein